MSGPCSDCGAARLVTVRIPGHDDIEAVLCLACGEPQRHLRSAAPLRAVSPPLHKETSPALAGTREGQDGRMEAEIEGTPNCPTCLHPLEIAGSDTRPHWSCPSCGHAVLNP